MILPVETRTVKPRLLVFLIPFGIVFIMLLVFKDRLEFNTYARLLLISGIIVFIVWLLLRKVMITIDNEGLIHKTAFSTSHILWSEVTETFIRYQHHGKSGNFQWNFQTAYSKKMSFSTGLYSRNDLKTIAEAVVTKCENAVIDPKIVRISEGKFPWYIF